MNIGNTPQEKLATIRYIYKRALIVDAILLLIFVVKFLILPIGYILFASSGETIPLVEYFISLILGFIQYTAGGITLVWAFYWLKGRLKPGSLALIGAAAARTVNSGNTYEVYRDSITGDTTITKKKNWLPLLIVAVLFFYVVGFIGLFYAIKYAVEGLRLKKQLEE